jgi:hypothetical protein
VVSFTPRPLYPQGKSPWYPLDRRLVIQLETKERFGSTKDEMMMFQLLKLYRVK